MPTSPPSFRPIGAPTRQEFDRLRGSASARGYGRKWQQARAAFLRSHPVCACGCEHPATEVDHIIPHRGNHALFWDRSNWQGLTKECHSAKTGRGQ